MIPAISTAVAGMNAIGERVQDRAERIGSATAVNAPEPGEKLDPVMFEDELVNDVAGLGLDKTAFKANAEVVKTTQEMEKQLLDIIA